jgi:hypothetical protein
VSLPDDLGVWVWRGQKGQKYPAFLESSTSLFRLNEEGFCNRAYSSRLVGDRGIGKGHSPERIQHK